MKAAPYKRSTIPTFKNNNGDTYIYGKKYVKILLEMLHSKIKTKMIDKNRVTIERVVDDEDEWTVYVSLARV